MVDITSKQVTLRTARAQAKIFCSAETIGRIKNDTLPKGNLFDIARAAGYLGAKRTPDLIPHCHPISVDHLELTHQVKDDHVLIEVFAQVIARTGLEMEVLTSASVAALTIYDLLKPIDKGLEIGEIKLLEKTGGRSGQKKKVKPGIRCCVLVCSDSTAAGKREDKSGKIIQGLLAEYQVDLVEYKVVPDETSQIQQQVKAWVEDDIAFIFTTGGTGLSPRDNTVNAIKEIIEVDAPGIAEVMRSYGSDRTPLAMHSRSIAGAIRQTMIVTLPGSSNGARESLEAILPAIFHARKMLKGGGH